MITWQLGAVSNSSAGQSRQITYYIATTSGGNVVSQSSMSSLVQPVLQAQDRSFYGSLSASGGMVNFDKSGNVQWSVPGDTPHIATADDGVVGASRISYDGNGNVTGLVGTSSAAAMNSTAAATPDVMFNATAAAASNTSGNVASELESWVANVYQVLTGNVAQLSVRPVPLATPNWSLALGNPSGSGTSSRCHDNRDETIYEYQACSVSDSYFQSPVRRSDRTASN
jgi:hypothetical protein